MQCSFSLFCCVPGDVGKNLGSFWSVFYPGSFFFAQCGLGSNTIILLFQMLPLALVDASCLFANVSNLVLGMIFFSIFIHLSHIVGWYAIDQTVLGHCGSLVH